MVTMICEMCGCRDVVKRNGLYVCSECGTKYSPGDARKLIWRLSDDEEGNEIDHGGRSGASDMPPAYEDRSTAFRSMNVAAMEGANDNPSNGAAGFVGQFIGLISNAVLGTAVLCQVPQKVPSILHGMIVDLLFLLAGIAAAITLVLIVGLLVGRGSKRNASLSATTCSALCCVLGLMSLGDGPLFPVIYLFFALIDAIFALVLWKG
jgi:hypothetical protein